MSDRPKCPSCKRLFWGYPKRGSVVLHLTEEEARIAMTALRERRKEALFPLTLDCVADRIALALPETR